MTSDKPSLLLYGIAVGLLIGICEELGWTRIAVPGTRQSYGVFGTGLTVGAIWGMWHVLPFFWSSGDASGALSLGIFIPLLAWVLAVLPAYRVLMVWVYDHTQSLLVAVLMHAVLSGTSVIVMPMGIPGTSFFAMWYLAVAIAAWVGVAVVAIATGGQLSRRPFQTRVA